MTNPMAGSTSAGNPWDTRRWLLLGVIALAQLMVVLDVTIMNIALPSAQRALHFTTADRQWVVTAYTLAFGSLLLLGGRLADLLGRKVTFLVGLVGFAGVSAIGGASVNFTMLVTARACQGAFAAILVPSALSLLTTTFAGAVASYLATHLASPSADHQNLTSLALAHGYDTTFWWIAGILAGGAVIGGALLRPGPLIPAGAPGQAHLQVTSRQAGAGQPSLEGSKP
jgi:MFS family permease